MSAPYNGMLDDPTLTPEYKHWMACTINGVAAQAARGPVPYAKSVIHTEVLTNHGWVRVK